MSDIETLRASLRMSALVVMHEIGETDKALATAIAAKQVADLRPMLERVEAAEAALERVRALTHAARRTVAGRLGLADELPAALDGGAE